MNHGQNTGGGENPNRATGNFKLNIDERDLATGNIDLPERRSQPPRPEYSVNKAYLTEKERRAERKAHKKRDKLKARKNRRIFALVWVCMVLLVSFTLASYLIKGSNDFFAVGRSQGTTSVTIPENVTLDDLTQILYEAGAIKEPEFFSLFCMVTVDDDEMEYFQPGTYNLDTDLDYQAIISTLQGGNQTREEVRVTFPEGTTALEAAALLEENGVCSQEDFLAAINSTDFDSYEAIAPIAAITGKYYKLEGYLFPDTYDFYKGEEIDSVVGKLVNNFQNRTADLEERIAYLDAQERELREAISAGNMALGEIQSIQRSLSSAEGWGTWDVFGGGMISDMAKYSHMDEAQRRIQSLQRTLSRFRAELADVSIQADLQLQVDGFLRFADYFFDNIFTDWAVLDRIRRSQSQMEQAERSVQTILYRLDSAVAQCRRERDEKRRQRDELVLKA